MICSLDLTPSDDIIIRSLCPQKVDVFHFFVLAPSDVLSIVIFVPKYLHF